MTAAIVTAPFGGLAAAMWLAWGHGLSLTDNLLAVTFKVTVQVTAAVLLYRAVTYLPSIPLGAVACLIWRHAPALIGTSRLTPSRTAQGAVAAPA